MRIISATALLCLSLGSAAHADWTPERTDKLGAFQAKYVDGRMTMWKRNGKCFGVPSKKPMDCETMQVAAEPDNKTEAPMSALKKPGLVVANVSLAGVKTGLRKYIEGLAATCGRVTVISAKRNSRTPSGRASCHNTGDAVDIQIDDKACALKYAVGKPVGHSKDYCGFFHTYKGIACHFHVSTCRGEMGVRFVHRGYGEPRSTRYAKRYSKRRYAKYNRHKFRMVRYSRRASR